MSGGSFTWRCYVCGTAHGEAGTEPAAARAFLTHYCREHPDPIAAWNTAMKEGAK